MAPFAVVIFADRERRRGKIASIEKARNGITGVQKHERALLWEDDKPSRPPSQPRDGAPASASWTRSPAPSGDLQSQVTVQGCEFGPTVDRRCHLRLVCGCAIYNISWTPDDGFYILFDIFIDTFTPG